MKKLYSIPKGICLKFFILTGLLLLGISIKAQSNGGDTKTYAKGDINEDGYVNAADVVALVDIIMKGEGKEDGGDENPVYYPDVVKNQYHKRDSPQCENKRGAQWGLAPLRPSICVYSKEL